MALVGVKLDEGQREALKNMRNGCILCGGTGAGKTRVGLAYYHCIIGKGRIRPSFEPMTEPVDLYVITTAATRDKFGWEKEMVHFCLYDCRSDKVIEDKDSTRPLYDTKVTVDSWNNIQKYTKVEGAFFIFDEQRVTGHGPWVKSFQKIVKNNRWILLSATPGDTWLDYAQVFIANGFYKNITEFRDRHVIYNYAKGKFYYQKPEYFNTKRLERLRDLILVDMVVERDTVRHNIDILCSYDRGKYRTIMRTRWNPWTEEQIENVSALCQCLRKVVNTDASRLVNLLTIVEEHPKAIVFYNYNYELEMLRDVLSASGFKVAEWNGEKHEEVPTGDRWIYAVQYFANEGWQCITTDTMIFFSQNYSYKVMEQASGRIDRRNTPFKDLYYYHLKSKAPIDLAISRAISEKKTFNESRFMRKYSENKVSGA